MLRKSWCKVSTTLRHKKMSGKHDWSDSLPSEYNS